MSEKIVITDWQSIATISVFALTAASFAVATIRAIFMEKHQRAHMANLPLEND